MLLCPTQSFGGLGVRGLARGNGGMVAHMDTAQWLLIATYAGLFALACIAMLRMRSSQLAGPLALLCWIGFAWNFAMWAHSVTSNPAWLYVDRTVAPWTSPAGMHCILVFVGQRRRWRRALILSNLAFVVPSAVGAAGFFSPWGERAALSATWDNLVGALLGAQFVWGMQLLVSHLRRQDAPEEKMRTRLVITAIAFTVGMELVELASHEHMTVPPMLICVIVLTIIAFGFKLFDSDVTSLVIVYGAALAIVATSGYMVAFRILAPNLGAIALAVLAISLGWIALLAQAWRAASKHRTRLDRLTMLGRLSAQMAHDLKNPLAALKGAAQFLVEERARGRSIDGQRDFLDLLVSESERLSRLIDRYQRLAALDLTRAPVAVNDLVQRVLEMHRLAVPGDAPARLDLASALPECALDADLVSTALENVLRNASEASGGRPGPLTVRTERVHDQPERVLVAISVEDCGHGMNARELERAFDEFYSTRPNGTGLGLPVVKRVVEAHGGRLSVRSTVGRGTRVVLLFPVG